MKVLSAGFWLLVGKVEKVVKVTALTTLTTFAALAEDQVTIESSLVRMAFDGKGNVTSIRELAGGRELVKKPAPFVMLKFSDGKKISPASFGRDARGDLVFSFDGGGSCSLAVEPFDGGWSFRARLNRLSRLRVFRQGRILWHSALQKPSIRVPPVSAR